MNIKIGTIQKKALSTKNIQYNCITWISDDSTSFDFKKADSLSVTKEDNQNELKFTYYENKFPHVRSIRIRNSGSRYALLILS